MLNRTREEVARDYVTKTTVHADMSRVMDQLKRLDEKLDRMMERFVKLGKRWPSLLHGRARKARTPRVG